MDRAELLRLSLARVTRLRAAGPPTDEFLRWRDGADELIADLVGAEHPTRQRFRQAAGPFSAREAEGLQVEGPDGMLARLERGARILQEILGEDG